MSLLVNTIDVNKAKEELKKCPKIVREYVDALERSNDRWKEINKKALKKLRELSKK